MAILLAVILVASLVFAVIIGAQEFAKEIQLAKTLTEQLIVTGWLVLLTALWAAVVMACFEVIMYMTRGY